ncbi:TAXI family TRAP transporter solute-binding subunit [Marinobacterium maritimum]|uniref:TAXI family TRAP transporter solute-binding subunit n=2 Tax=Marinobacterium maritimum TaxID=500162 RepID=A0ABN1I626_9GAMM
MFKFNARSFKTLAASLCAGAILAASASQAQAAETFRMSTLGPGSSPYMVMTHFANTINKELPEYSIIVNATGVAPKHALDTAKGRGEFFMMSPSIHNYMKTGGGMFGKIKDAPELAQNLRAVFMFPMGLYQGVTYAEDNIQSLMDIKGKRVFAGPPGGVARRTVETMIRAATGYEPGEDYTSVKLGHESASQAFQDHNIDVLFNATVAPSPVISQVALTNKVRFIGVDLDTFKSNPDLQKLLSTPGYSIKPLEPGVYGENQVNTEPVYTIGINIGIATNKDLDEETVYKMTKAYWDDLEAQKASTPWLRNLSLDGVFADMNMPMHPGAARYFREIGLEVPEVK